MTTRSIYRPDGSVIHGELHPEIAEPSLAILKRDMRKMEKNSFRSFIRKPYNDLDEVGIALSVVQQRREVVAVLVISAEAHITNVRLMLNQSMLNDEIKKGNALNLFDAKPSKGFGAA